MIPEDVTIRKTPFLFLKWLVTIEFFLAILPFVIVTLANLRQSYDGTVLSRTVSYTFLVAIVLTTIVLVLGFAPFAMSDYFPIRMIGVLLPGVLVVALLADLLLVASLAQVGFLTFPSAAQNEKLTKENEQER